MIGPCVELGPTLEKLMFTPTAQVWPLSPLPGSYKPLYPPQSLEI